MSPRKSPTPKVLTSTSAAARPTHAKRPVLRPARGATDRPTGPPQSRHEPNTSQANSDASETEHLHSQLEALLVSLAQSGVFLSYTDHLTDAELYNRARHVFDRHANRQVALDYGDHLVIACIDLQRDQKEFLAFYADEAVRTSWAALWPEDKIPARRSPVANRDRWLARLRGNRSRS